MRTIVGGLIERLATYAGTETGAEAVASVDLFGTFSERVSSIVESRHDMPVEHVVALQVLCSIAFIKSLYSSSDFPRQFSVALLFDTRQLRRQSVREYGERVRAYAVEKVQRFS